MWVKYINKNEKPCLLKGLFVFNLCEETNEGQPRPKYIFNKCGTNIYFFTLQRFGPSPSLNFKWDCKGKVKEGIG